MWYAFSMRKYIGQNIGKYISCLLVIGLTAGAVCYISSESLVAEATTIGEVEEDIRRREQEIQALIDQISGLEDEQDLIEEQISDLNAEIINTMASISVLEDQIEEKETQLAEKGNQIADKQVQIEATEAEYNAAVEREEMQRQNMIDCTRMVYENQEASYLSSLLEGKGLSDILNQMDYIEKVYEYSVGRLEAYIEAKNQVHDLWDRLELEKAELEVQRDGLEQDRLALQADETELRDLKADLDVKLDKKRRESANFDAEIAKAQREANVAKTLLKQDQQKLKQLQAAQNAANMTIATTSYTALIDSAAGSDLGKRIAKFACQYVGNPYVSGGTSLTNGADCSGFTYRVYQEFGYSIPRTSYQQRSAGTGVAYENAQPGDLICYDGHVAMYIGSGMIVHASSAKTGIKVSRAQYRTILAVRRIIP
ncbi:MAG: NlpC/P60 family protein [Butyrivibrio sp.]|nr:NlpC/P60 family protein [Acetatifactor muris]MCM1560675.1 NlpC/P60 family protein [Butyrivibrio sp.]